MSDEKTVEKIFQIQKIYSKEMSFESPNSPEIFTKEFNPDLKVDLNVSTKKLENDIYHATLLITVTATQEETTGFLCEVEQAGIFTLSGFDDEEIKYILGVKCPETLFPFCRESISDAVTKGGFSQLLLDPVNFEAAYVNQIDKQQQDDKKEETS